VGAAVSAFSERIDHADQAREILRQEWQTAINSPLRTAQIHATLAVADAIDRLLSQLAYRDAGAADRARYSR
jgi:hypothetical protein